MLDYWYIIFPIILGLLIALSRPAAGKRPRVQRETPVPANAIVVDGSNVMHWGGAPSAKVLHRVMRAIEAKGFTPIVFFDANAGYKLGDRYFDEKKLAHLMGVPPAHVCVAHKGVVADEWILDFATKHGLRVFSNDRFKDWGVTFPLVKERGRVMRGTWKEGSVVWRR